MSILEVEHLVAGYSGEEVLRDINFTVDEGEVFVILGGSGCGKSTLLKHLIGLYAPFSGNILIEGKDITKAHGTERNKILQKIGVMYQQGALFGNLTLLENVRLPLEEFTSLPSDALNFVATLKLRSVGLESYAEYFPSEISGGMKKRAAIARAMVLDPNIVFLDEPSAGLDPVTSRELDELILTLSKSLGITFVIVTHELASIFAIAQRVIMLDKRAKTIIAEGNPNDLAENSSNPWVRQFFNREVSND